MPARVIQASKLYPEETGQWFFLHKGGGPVFNIFNFILGALYSRWRKRDWKPWHMSIPIQRTMTGWFVMEGASPKSRIHHYSFETLDRNAVRAYKWLDKKPDSMELGAFMSAYVGKKYDVDIYFWTAAQYLVRRFWNRRIPRLLDDRYTCWEFACEWAEANGKPFQAKYDCPFIIDILDALEGVTNDKEVDVRVNSPWGLRMQQMPAT